MKLALAPVLLLTASVTSSAQAAQLRLFGWGTGPLLRAESNSALLGFQVFQGSA
jgi:hypothetical protein